MVMMTTPGGTAMHDDYRMPPQPKGSTPRELAVIAELYRIALQTEDKRVSSPMRNGVQLIVDLIEERARIRTFGEQWDEAADGD
jgi:hypothetical protein